MNSITNIFINFPQYPVQKICGQKVSRYSNCYLIFHKVMPDSIERKTDCIGNQANCYQESNKKSTHLVFIKQSYFI